MLSFKFFHLIKFCLSFQRECCLKSFYSLCHSFNSSGGSVLLISSSIIPSSQVHVIFLPCSTGVLSEFDLPCSLFILFQPEWFNSFLSILLIIHSFATSKVHMVFLVSIFYRSALNCVQLHCVLSFNFSTSQGSLVSLFCRRSNLVLPPLFLFCFLSGAILDLGTRSSHSGGVL